MKTQIWGIVPITVYPIGNFRSLPAEVGSGCPFGRVVPPRPLEHPQEMSTGTGLEIGLIEPTNESILAL